MILNTHKFALQLPESPVHIFPSLSLLLIPIKTSSHTTKKVRCKTKNRSERNWNLPNKCLRNEYYLSRLMRMSVCVCARESDDKAKWDENDYIKKVIFSLSLSLYSFSITGRILLGAVKKEEMFVMKRPSRNESKNNSSIAGKILTGLNRTKWYNCTEIFWPILPPWY